MRASWYNDLVQPLVVAPRIPRFASLLESCVQTNSATPPGLEGGEGPLINGRLCANHPRGVLEPEAVLWRNVHPEQKANGWCKVPRMLLQLWAVEEGQRFNSVVNWK